MPTITLNKEKLVIEDLEQGTGSITQSRGVGTKISASTLMYDDTTTLKTAIDSKDSSIIIDDKLALKADLHGSQMESFEVADGALQYEAVNRGQLDSKLALKADITYVDGEVDLKADKDNVLGLNNTFAFTPVAQYQPATKKYVDDAVFAAGSADMTKAIYDTNNNGRVDTTDGIGVPATFMGVTPNNQVMRLGQTAITDCNAISDIGIFVGTDVANAPVSGEIGLEQLQISTGKTQRCVSLTSRDSYIRTYNNVSWSPWNKQLDQGDIVTNLNGSSDPFAVLHAQQGKAIVDNTVAKDSATGAAYIPSGTTAQRPSVPSNGYLRYNSDLLSMEAYVNGAWSSVADSTGVVLTTTNQSIGGFKNFTGTLQANGANVSAYGKNYIINGGFNYWNYATSQTSSGYGSDDRWTNSNLGSTKTHSQIASTDLEIGFFNSSKFSKTVVTSVAGAGNYCSKSQVIENVTKLAGKTVTLSFWANANTNKNIAIEFAQVFGTGGTPSAVVSGIGSQLVSLTSVWQKKTITVTLPSIVGKTLGTDGVHTSGLFVSFWFDAGSNFNTRTASLGQQSGTFNIAEVKLEEGSVATPWTPYEGEFGGELQACQRYFQNLYTSMFVANTNVNAIRVSGAWTTTMRIAPTIVADAQNNTAPAVTIYGWTVVLPQNRTTYYTSASAEL